jgi:periplasmic protein TonB
MAVAVTLGLLMVMNFMIQTSVKGPDATKEYKVPDIIMPEREMEVKLDTSRPEKLVVEQEPIPDIPDMQFDPNATSGETINIAVDTSSKLDTGPGLAQMDGEMIPLSVPEPEYPRSAANKGQEGYCVAKFTVTAQGTARDITVGDCPDKVFEKSTLRAAGRLKFKPKVVEGTPVDVPNQAYKYVYRMAPDAKKK